MSEMRQTGREGRRFEARIPITDPGALGRQCNGQEHTHIEISVSYDAGGINYFTYKTDPRGYTLAVQPVRVTDSTVSFTIGQSAGRRFYIERAPRYNAKRLQELARLITPELIAIAERLTVGDYAGIRQILTDTIGPRPEVEQVPA